MLIQRCESNELLKYDKIRTLGKSSEIEDARSEEKEQYPPLDPCSQDV